MSRCPNCDAENPPEAAHCGACGEPLHQSAFQGDAIPPRGQHEEPEQPTVAAVSGDTREQTATVVAVDEAAGTPDPPAAYEAIPETERTDRVVPTTPQVARDQPDRVVSAAPQRPAQAAEGASLIGEDDLPAWLRAWDAGEGANQSAAPDAEAQAWMDGGEPEPDEPPPPVSVSSYAASATTLVEMEQTAGPAATTEPARASEARPRSRGEAVFAQVAQADLGDVAGRERVSAWRAPAEPAPQSEGRGVPELPPRPVARPIPARARRKQQQQASPLALAAVIAAALFFLFSLIFFLFVVVF